MRTLRCGVIALGIALLTAAVGLAPAGAAAADLEISISSAGQTSPGVIPEPANCFGPLSPLFVLATLTNDLDVAQATSLFVTLDPGWQFIPDSCSASTGVCTIQNALNLMWSGTIDAESFASILFGLRFDSDVPAGTQLCLTLVAQFGDGMPITALTCATTNSARQCGLGAPALGNANLLLLGALLLLSGGAVLRRRSR